MRIQNIRNFFATFLLVTLMIVDVGAENVESESLELHIEKAVEQVLKNNPRLKAEKEMLRIDQGRLEQAKRLFQLNPELSVDANHRQRKSSSPSGMSGTDFELRFLQEIEIFGQRRHRTEAAKKYLKEAGWRVTETERQLRLKVVHLFYDLLTLQEKIKIQEKRLALHEDLFNTGQKRFQEKDISILEIDTLRFDRDQVQHDFTKLESEKLIVEKALQSFLGLNEEAAFVAVGQLSTLLSQVRKGPDSLEELETCALEHRPDLKSVQAALEGDAASFQLALSKKMPNLSLGPLFKSDNEDQVIGVSLMIPLPFFNRNQEEVTEARVSLDVKKIVLDSKNLEIRREAAAAYRQRQLAKERFDSYGADYLDRLKEHMVFPKRAYRAGEISIFEFSVAQGRLANAQIRYLNTLLTLLKASADLDAQLGACRFTEKR